MIFRFAAFLAAFWLAAPTLAQTVTIRSGEHEAFSRLTMTLPSRIGWTIKEAESGAEVIFDRGGLTLDTSAVFDRIPRSRLAGISWSGQDRRLALDFNCDCNLSGFWHDNTMLVLDVRGTPFPTDDETLDGAVKALPARHHPEPEPAMALPVRSGSHATRMLHLSLESAQSVDPNTTADTASLPEPAPIIARQETRDRLLRQVGRAASQGLLSPQVSLPERRAAAPDRETATAETPHPESVTKTAEAVQKPATTQINLKAQSSIDRDFLGSMLAQAQNLSDSGCLTTAQVDVVSWGSQESFGAQVSALRLRLTGEFDDPDPAIVEKLARLYLYFGFGAEAAALLPMMPEAHADREILAQLAQIAEHGWAAPGSVLNGQLECESPAALWSALSYERLPADQQIADDAILRAFNALPLHLRAYYGPMLARRFLQAGNEEMSDKLLRIVDRSGVPETPQAEMAKAQSDLAKGDTVSAEQKLNSVVQRGAEPSPDALVQMIDTRIARGQEVSYEIAQLAGAYAFELQNDAAGLGMAVAHIRALAASGAFDQAYNGLAQLPDGVNLQRRADLNSELLGMLARAADEVTFLRHALPEASEPLAGLHPRDGNAAARRLLDLGFPAQAAALVRGGAQASRATIRERQLIRAEIALRNDRPRQAIVELLDLTGEEANALRARARSAAGDHSAAYHLFAARNEPDRAAREAWLNRDWERAAQSGGDVYQTLARLKSGGTATNDPNGAAVLARNQALLEASTQTRDTLTALLAANPQPELSDSNP